MINFVQTFRQLLETLPAINASGVSGVVLTATGMCGRGRWVLKQSQLLLLKLTSAFAGDPGATRCRAHRSTPMLDVPADISEVLCTVAAVTGIANLAVIVYMLAAIGGARRQDNSASSNKKRLLMFKVSILLAIITVVCYWLGGEMLGGEVLGGEVLGLLWLGAVLPS